MRAPSGVCAPLSSGTTREGPLPAVGTGAGGAAAAPPWALLGSVRPAGVFTAAPKTPDGGLRPASGHVLGETGQAVHGDPSPARPPTSPWELSQLVPAAALRPPRHPRTPTSCPAVAMPASSRGSGDCSPLLESSALMELRQGLQGWTVTLRVPLPTSGPWEIVGPVRRSFRWAFLGDRVSPLQQRQPRSLGSAPKWATCTQAVASGSALGCLSEDTPQSKRSLLTQSLGG